MTKTPHITQHEGFGSVVYDAIVAPSSGDYSDIQSAIDAGHKSIFIRSGTYTPTADIVLTDGCVLYGEDRNSVIIDFGDAIYQIQAIGASGTELKHIEISNLTIKNTTHTNGGIYFYYVQWSKIDHCYFENVNNYALRGANCNYLQFTNNFCFNKAGVYCSGGSNFIVSGNTFKEKSSVTLYHHAVVSGNDFHDSYLAIQVQGYTAVSGNRIYNASGGISLNYYDSIAVGNFINCSGTGISISQSKCTVVGNYIYAGQCGITLPSARNQNVVVGNTIAYCGTNYEAIKDYGGFQNIVMNNILPNAGKPLTGGGERNCLRMKNTSGATITGGSVVVFKSVANGDEVTTTTTKGDNKVFGMAEQDVANNSYSLFQTIGKTTTLRVNGTDPITIGDFLCTYTEAGIACKAGAGDMIFAIALEAYAVADSNGVIDALLITPRKI